MPFTDPPTGAAAVADTYYVDYITDLTDAPPNPDFSEASYYCTHPENLQMDDTIGDIGNASWEWSYSALDVEGNPILRESDFIHPWRSWFRVRYGTTVIMAGPVVRTNATIQDQFVKIAGQTWEAYFPRWQFPFDPRPDHVNDYVYPNTFIGNEDSGHVFSAGGSGTPTPTGLCYQAQNRDIVLIARDLLIQIRDAVPDRMQMEFGEFETPVGITTNFQYTLGDDSGIDSTLSTLTGVGEGFDYWVGWDRTVHVGSPYRYGNPLSPTISYTIVVTTPGLLEFEYENVGIQASHVLGRGAGLAAQTQMASAFGYAASQDQFSRLDISFDYGDVRNQTQLDNLTKKSLSLVINPVRDVPVTIDPAQIIAAGDNYWSIFRKGVCIFVTVDTLFHPVNAPYRLRSWSAGDNQDTGNFEVQLSLDRIYPEVADFGNPDL